jgi:RNA polymerase sigma factor (sigma-70 family)
MEKRSRLEPLARAVLRTQSDHRLVALARDGKEAAFEEIVRRYRAPLVAFAAAYGPPDAEDVVQESLLRSWGALRNSTGEMNLKAWLYTIVRNRAHNARRDARPHQQLSDDIDGVPQPPDVVLSNDELRRAVVAIGALPEPQREALVRSALEGHTHDQIAAAIGSTPGAVRQLIYRARMTVRHGVGAVIPLPLVAALVGSSGAGAGAAAGGATGGAAAAGAAGGISLAAKTALVAAVGAVAIGSGAAIKNGGDSGPKTDRVEQTDARQAEGPASNGPSGSEDSQAAEDDPASVPDDHGRGEGGSSGSDDGPGDDRGGESGGGSNDGPSDDSSGSSGEGPGPSGSGSDDGPGGDSSGPGPGGDDSSHSGPGSGSSGSGSSGSGGSTSGSDDGGSSGPGGGGDTTTSEPDNSGPGGGGETTTTTTTVPETDSSGSGSGELELPHID